MMADTADLLDEPTKVTTADELRALLRRKFPAEAFAMLYEVRDAAGFSAQRSADVVMVGLWPSRGCQIDGMEIKVSRSDWLRELKKPEKAEAFVPYCDRWWIVAGNMDVVKLSELPPTWGLMVPSCRGLKIVTEAPKLDAKPLDRSLLAAMLKRATATSMDDPEIQAAIAAKVKAEKERFHQHDSYELQTAKSRAEQLQRNLDAFEQASGVQIRAYNGQRIGEAVRAVMNHEHERRIDEARGLRKQMRELLAYMDREFPDEKLTS